MQQIPTFKEHLGLSQKILYQLKKQMKVSSRMAILGDSKVWIYKTKRGNLKLEKKKITVFQG